MIKKFFAILISLFIILLICSCNKAPLNDDEFADSTKINIEEDKSSRVIKNHSEIKKAIINIQDYSDEYTWVKYSEDNQIKYAVADKNGNVVVIIENSDLEPMTGFMHGVSYVTTTGGVYIIDTSGEIIVSAAENKLNDLVAYGYDEEHSYFMFHKHVADFSSAHEEYIIYDESGTILDTVTAEKEYYDVWYCGETVWAFKKGENLYGNLCMFYNHENDLFFDVDDGLLYEPGDAVCQFSSGYASNISGGYPVFINSETGEVYSWEYLEDYHREIGRMSNGVAVISAYDYYDTNKFDKSIDFLGYIHPTLTDAKVEYFDTKFRDGSIVNRMYSRNVTRYRQYMFDDNGHMLIQMTGADGLEYFTILNMDGEMIIEPIVYDYMISLYISCDRFSVIHNNIIYVYNGNGELVYSSEDRNWDRISTYSKDVVVVDGNKVVDKDGNVLFDELNMVKAHTVTVRDTRQGY